MAKSLKYILILYGLMLGVIFTLPAKAEVEPRGIFFDNKARPATVMKYYHNNGRVMSQQEAARRHKMNRSKQMLNGLIPAAPAEEKE